VGLPDPPKVELEVVRDRTAEAQSGFLELKRLDLVTRHGGTSSAPFAYDIVERRALDACVMVAHHEADGRVHVWIRTAIRPPIALRSEVPQSRDQLWEVPAGLIEPGESPAAAAARELEEELGFSVTAGAMKPLGPPALPAPGFVAEVHHYFHVPVDPASRREPAGDGSPLEDGALVIAVPLDDVLEACESGRVPDAKTELALRRLRDLLTP
jgi:ADP-ribose pyrophosphatase